jgi:hypothetical protein
VAACVGSVFVGVCMLQCCGENVTYKENWIG